MEQVINPSPNSEKYIKETDTKVKEFSNKIDSLEKQYTSVIKTKDDEITAEKKKVNDISSSLNSKDNRIKELENLNTTLRTSIEKFNKLKEYLYWYKRVDISVDSVQGKPFPQDYHSMTTISSSYSVKVSDTFTLDTNSAYVVYGRIGLDSEAHNCYLEVHYSGSNTNLVNVRSSHMFISQNQQNKERSTGGYYRFFIPKMNSRQVNCNLAVNVCGGNSYSKIKIDGYLIFQKIPDTVYNRMELSAYISDLKEDIKEHLAI